jgi:hypothetical protein
MGKSVRLVSFRDLLLVLIVLVISVGLYFVFSHGQSLRGVAGNFTTVNSTVLGYAGRVLVEARVLYTNAIAENESNLVDVLDDFTRGLILNGTFINGTTLTIGHTQYRYVILRVYYNGFSFFPEKIQGNGIRVVLLPKPATVTYTGGWVGHYLVTYNGKTYNVTLFDVPLMVMWDYVSTLTQRIGNLYIIQTWINKEPGKSLPNGELWIILTKP